MKVDFLRNRGFSTSSQSQKREFKKSPESSSRFPTTFCASHRKTYDVKSRVFEVLWNLRKKGYSEDTIKNSYKALKYLSKHCDLEDPESVEGFIAQLDHSNGWKKRARRTDKKREWVRFVSSFPT